MNQYAPSHGSEKHKTPRGNNRWLWLVGCGAFAVVAIVVLAMIPEGGSGRSGRRSPSGETSAKNGPASNSDSASTGAKAAAHGEHSSDEISLESLQKLVGRWKRSDADYVLKIKSVDAQGKLDATYLNPSQIHVEKAHAHSHGEAAHLTIELRDVNYPGCIYDLHFNAAQDKLTGTYFQAALGETYEVSFQREE